MQQTTTSSPALVLVERSEAARQVMLSVLFGALTALSAHLSIPWYPVPITGQVFMVLLSGALLGPRLGLMSQLTYLGIGIAGAPVFAGGNATLLALMGPTAGYLLAFPPAAYVAGLLAPRARSFPALLMVLAAPAVLILLAGGLWLGLGSTMALWPLVEMRADLGAGLRYGLIDGALRFLPVDGPKVLAAALVAWPVIRAGRER